MGQRDNKTIDLLEAAAKKRLPLKDHTNAVRLVNDAGDGLEGLVLEQYNRHFVAQIFDKRWLAEKEALAGFVKGRLHGEYLVIKDRTESNLAHPDVFKASTWIEYDTSQTIVQENGLKFRVDLNDTLNSGLFLDMRYNRKVVSGLSKGRKVLNCFAYTCSFGVYCRAAGALSVVNVDISRKSLNRGRFNYGLNQMVGTDNEFICLDAAQYLKRAGKKDNHFDLIILDPPSFSRHEGKTFRLKKDFPQLIALAIDVLAPGGFLFAAANLSGISCKDLENMARAAAQKRQIKRMQRLGQDEDFPGSGISPKSYLAALLVEMQE